MNSIRFFFILNSEGSQQISSQCSKTGDLYHKETKSGRILPLT